MVSHGEFVFSSCLIRLISSHSHIFFGEISVQTFCLFFYCVVCNFIIEFQEYLFWIQICHQIHTLQIFSMVILLLFYV